jgi:2-polyprenyl-3-methyl-5-hydroxy-6-metoxy-1,4-benzoquinol methylase
VDWQLTKGDLRIDWGLPQKIADIILCTEVVEHLSDPPMGFQDSFERIGLQNFLKLCHQTLKPGGMLFITTPNSTSIIHLKNILAGYTPWYYKLHVREYSKRELVSLLEDARFYITKIKTVHCLTSHTEEDYTPIYFTLLQHQYETSDRGDDIFIVAQK